MRVRRDIFSPDGKVRTVFGYEQAYLETKVELTLELVGLLHEIHSLETVIGWRAKPFSYRVPL